MTMNLLAIYWHTDPVLLHIGDYGLRWYTVMYASVFLTGWLMFTWFCRRETVSKDIRLPLLITLIVSVLVGLRLGQCIFYNPRHYFGSWQGVLDIFKIWKGGLASHGAVIGVMLGMWWFSSRFGKRFGVDFLWLMDRIVIVAAFAGVLIRTGNFFNSEIYGPATDLPWGVVFENRGQAVPHHPTQLYEALAYLLIGMILLWLYRFKLDKLHRGVFMGLFGVLCFGARFLLEYVKTVKVFVNLGFTTLTMGQALSIPLIITGICLIAYAGIRKTPAKAGAVKIS